jgi:hypothetical protein
MLSALFRFPVPSSNMPLGDVGSANAMDGYHYKPTRALVGLVWH